MFKRIVVWFEKQLHPEAYVRRIGVRMGGGCRLIKVDFSSEPYLITQGDRVSATKARFETYDGGVWVLRDRNPGIDIVKPITVGSNVFIGYGATILPGAPLATTS